MKQFGVTLSLNPRGRSKIAQKTPAPVYSAKTPEEAREAVRRKKAAGIEIVKFNEYVAPEVIKAGAEEANKLGMPITRHCLDVFLAAENNFAGVEHHFEFPIPTVLSPCEKVQRSLDTHNHGS